MQSQFKFKIVVVKTSAGELERALNDGWELVQAHMTGQVGIYMLRKLKKARR